MSRPILIDSHCHLNTLDLAAHHGGLDEVITTATTAGVEYILCPGIDLEHFPEVLAIAKHYPRVFAAVGVHPSEKNIDLKVADLLERAQDPAVVAIGETGLDYARISTEAEREQQRELFKTHILAAREIGKPIIVHSRAAGAELIDLLRENHAAEVGGVMHCFTEDWAMAKAALELNFYISIAGIVTFKNADTLRAVVKLIPADRLLLETDAPFLAPVPFRGKQNVPAYLIYIAEKIAEIRGESLEQVARETSENFMRLFKV